MESSLNHETNIDMNDVVSACFSDQKPNAILTLGFGSDFHGDKIAAMNNFLELAWGVSIAQSVQNAETRKVIAIGLPREYGSAISYHFLARLNASTRKDICSRHKAWRDL